MKTCPTCGSRYADETLFYCLDDGTPLVGSNMDTPTVVYADVDTVVRRSGSQYETAPLPEAARPSGTRNVALAVVLTAFGTLVLVGIAAVVLFIYLGSGSPSSDGKNANLATSSTQNGNTSTPNTNAAMPTPTPTPVSNSSIANTTTPTNSGSPSALPPPNSTEDKQNVSNQLYSWRSAMVAQNLDAFMGYYADNVDYYTKPGVSRSTVRADKARAFGMYDSMSVNISNLDISVSPSGDSATATFDKEWTFQGTGVSRGKVRSRFEFRRINGRWLITSERDMRVYYMS